MKRKISPDDVKKMRAMRRKGLSTPAIGREFGVDHSTVIYWLQERTMGNYHMRYMRKKSFRWKEVEKKPEVINTGKLSYAQYLKEDKSRKKVEASPEEKLKKRNMFQRDKKWAIGGYW